MIERVRGIQEKRLEDYRGIVDDSVITDVQQYSRELSGLRVCHIGSTPFGAGIPELLSGLIPLEREAGLEVDWFTPKANERFAYVAKQVFNALQGSSIELNASDSNFFQQVNRQIAHQLSFNKYDVVIVHNQQLIGLPRFVPASDTFWVWRCHMDTSSPNQASWEKLRPLLSEFDAAVFSAREFIPADLKVERTEVFTPGIDPLSPKNRELPLAQCLDFVSGLGIDPRHPILLMTSQVDPWKDPMGAIRTYELAKEHVPTLQLVITSALAVDDPETFSTLRILDAETSKDEDMHVFTNMDGFGDIEVNAFQRVCRVGILKSLREGFGISVAEMMWKNHPVLGSRVGGIVHELRDKLEFCLVDGSQEAAKKLVKLIRDDKFTSELGEFGHEVVRQNYLLPRWLRDELGFLASVKNRATPSSVSGQSER